MKNGHIEITNPKVDRLSSEAVIRSTFQILDVIEREGWNKQCYGVDWLDKRVVHLRCEDGDAGFWRDYFAEKLPHCTVRAY